MKKNILTSEEQINILYLMRFLKNLSDTVIYKNIQDWNEKSNEDLQNLLEENNKAIYSLIKFCLSEILDGFYTQGFSLRLENLTLNQWLKQFQNNFSFFGFVNNKHERVAINIYYCDMYLGTKITKII